MKPDFALSLSMEGIALMCRSKTGWHLIGDVPLEHRDLGEALAALRDEADVLSGGDAACKLVLPNDQIKYLQIPAAASDAEQQVIDALDGATPYAVTELAFDFTEIDDEFLIAAVAKETLQEAEEFALQHGFKPVCFVAIPEGGEFDGEPFFGATQAVETLLGAGVLPTPDIDAIEISGAGRPYEFSPIGESEELPAPTPSFSSIREKISGQQTEQSQDEASRQVSPRFTPVTAEPPARPESPVQPEPEPEPAAEPEQDVELPEPTAFVSPPKNPAPIKPPAPEPQVAKPAPFVAEPPAKPEPVAQEPAPAAIQPQPAPSLVATTQENDVNPTEISASLMAAPMALKRLTTRAKRVRAKPARARQNNEQRRLLALAVLAFISVTLASVLAWSSLATDRSIASVLFGRELTAEAQADVDIEALAPSSEETLTDSAEIEALEEGIPVPEVTLTEAALLEAEARYAATGIWDLAPIKSIAPSTEDLKQLYIGSFETSQITHDAIALPSAEALIASDLGIAAQVDPLPFGTEITFDDRGLVVASPEGTLSPNWVMVFSGKPQVVPASFPTRAIVTPENLTQDELDALRDRLSQLRPKARPSDILEQNERSSLGGITLSELAAIRPQMRPEDPAFAAAAAVVASIDPNDLVGGTEYAVTLSIRPEARPAGFAKKVERLQSQVSTVAVPAAAATAPSIPTSASVARSATQANAINLRRINLIGVYGTTSDRRALVRLVSGRYKKITGLT